MNIKIRRIEPDDAGKGIIETLGRLSHVGLSISEARRLIMNIGSQSTIYVAEYEDE